MATLGSIPNALADWADCKAISASCSAVGSGLMAQSPYTTTCSGSSIKKIDDTSEYCGAVLINWNAGRTVLAVVCTAPDTRPSTSPKCSIIVPSTTVSLSCSWACSSSSLPLRRSTMGLTYLSIKLSGSRICRPSGRVSPKFLATSSTSLRLASKIQWAIPRVWQITAASTVRGSLPSGSTMVFLAAWAFLTKVWRKAEGESLRLLLPWLKVVLIQSKSKCAATKSVTSLARVVSSAGISWLMWLSLVTVSKLSVSTSITGIPVFSAGRHRLIIFWFGMMPPVRIRPASGTPFMVLSAVAKIKSSRSPAVTSKLPRVKESSILATVRATSKVLSTRRFLASPSLSHLASSSRATSQVRGTLKVLLKGTTPIKRNLSESK